MATYTVRYTTPTGIPGYEPAYQVAQGVTWGQAYDWARALPASIASGRPFRLDDDGLERLYVALRDGGTEARAEVWSHQTGIVLGRPFTPQLLGTITVTAEGAA